MQWLAVTQGRGWGALRCSEIVWDGIQIHKEASFNQVLCGHDVCTGVLLVIHAGGINSHRKSHASTVLRPEVLLGLHNMKKTSDTLVRYGEVVVCCDTTLNNVGD